MDRGAGVPMDAGQDVWDWEVLPDHRSFSMGHGSVYPDDQETEEHTLPPSGDCAVDDEPVVECKDIGVVPDETTKPVPSVADLMASDGDDEEKAFQNPDETTKPVPSVADLMTSDGDDEEKAFQNPDAKEASDDKFAEEEEDAKKENSKARPECVVFSVGKLKVNGIGALCSFGVAAATVCIFLIGGRLQHHHRQQQQQKIQLQFYGDDKRIQQVVQQTSRLNQAMSSVMGAGGASTRANISFGGFYPDGF
ncbi:hypothetical protein BAE44_0013248 [Dichanthelium oligosanthes]|uniref:DUF6821 domain-containing protein n=1 Tax=Dichanthelium oligosanthes TaxID=888268 RepID=A0A1E5VKX5_9POAL|nr:hypothetical protein BAE44_0013248 [Dichanthelium oligosanthes]